MGGFGCRGAAYKPQWLKPFNFILLVARLKAVPFPIITLKILHFLKRFSNACRASLGRATAGVDVSFSLVTRISYNWQSFRASLRGMRTATGCMHSKRLPGSKYAHCLQE
jgi:hypothetical protein